MVVLQCMTMPQLRNKTIQCNANTTAKEDQHSSDPSIGPPKAAVMGRCAGPDMENISVTAGDLRNCKSALGYCYKFASGWPVRGDRQLLEEEAYCNADILPMGSKSFWPF